MRKEKTHGVTYIQDQVLISDWFLLGFIFYTAKLSPIEYKLVERWTAAVYDSSPELANIIHVWGTGQAQKIVPSKYARAVRDAKKCLQDHTPRMGQL